MNAEEKVPHSEPHAAPHGAQLGMPGEQTAPPGPAGRTPLYLLMVLGSALAILAGLTVLSRSRASAELESDTLENLAPTVSVVHPKRGPAQIHIDIPGNITAYEESPIYARVSGYLKQWYTDIGTQVAAGQLLAEIDTPELDEELVQANAALDQANANLEIARISAERWQNLRKSDSVSQQDTDVRVATWHAREADVAAAKANVKRLMELTNFKKLTAPFPGIITGPHDGRGHAHYRRVVAGDFSPGPHRPAARLSQLAASQQPDGQDERSGNFNLLRNAGADFYRKGGPDSRRD